MLRLYLSLNVNVQSLNMTYVEDEKIEQLQLKLENRELVVEAQRLKLLGLSHHW